MNTQFLGLWLLVFGLLPGLYAQTLVTQGHSIHSTHLQELRHYQVLLPQSYESDAFYLEKDYPVLIVLDGDRLVPLVGQMVQTMSGGSVEQIPEMIVVGISNTDRNRDFRPPYSEDDIGLNGPQRFLSFLQEELLPQLAVDFRTTGCPYILGHSFAGLFVTDAWVEQAGFCGYLAIDPSLGWANAGLLAKDKLAELANSTSAGDLYLAQANNPFNPGIWQGGNRAAMRELNDMLESKGSHTFRHEFFPEEDHFSIPLQATYHGLRFLFRDYQFDLQRISTASIEEIRAYYLDLEQRTAGIQPPAKLLHQVALFLHSSEEHSEKARHLLQWLIEVYPAAQAIQESFAQISGP